MKKRVANQGVAICVITMDPLSGDNRFVLPCCHQDVSIDAITTWFKKSETSTCPCCRDVAKARCALRALGRDLTPTDEDVANSGTNDHHDQEIFDRVMAGIAPKSCKGRCFDYHEFFVRLIEKRQYTLAHQIIDTLSDEFYNAPRQDKPLLSKTIICLLDMYEGKTPPVLPNRRRWFGSLHRLTQFLNEIFSSKTR